jgi:hypothetical protein
MHSKKVKIVLHFWADTAIAGPKQTDTKNLLEHRRIFCSNFVMLLAENIFFSPNFQVCTEGALDILDKDILVLANA